LFSRSNNNQGLVIVSSIYEMDIYFSAYHSHNLVILKYISHRRVLISLIELYTSKHT